MIPIFDHRRMLLIHHDLWFQTITGVLATAILLLPLLPVLVWALARWRRRRTDGWRTAILDVGLAYGTGFPIWLTMVPGGNHEVSLVPFRDMATMPPSQIIGNLLLLSALGFLAPMRFKALASFGRIVALGMAVSCTIEICQYVLPIGRIASVDDVLLNTAGVAMAAIASYPWWVSCRLLSRDRQPGTAGRGSVGPRTAARQPGSPRPSAGPRGFRRAESDRRPFRSAPS